MGTLKKVTNGNFKPTVEGNGRFPVYAQQFNEAITTLAVGTAVTSLTDSSGGTASDTIADITDAGTAGSADRVPTENAIASLAAKVESLTVALRSAGIIT